MKSAEQAVDTPPSSEPAAPGLEDLIPIAVMIGAGCEGCTRALVQRARRRGTSAAAIARALGIVARVCSVECLMGPVGSEAVGRMRRCLEVAEKALRREQRGKGRGCCGRMPAHPGPEPG